MRSPWTRKRAICPARPAARRRISPLVTVKKWRSGIRASPVYRAQPAATPATRPAMPPPSIDARLEPPPAARPYRNSAVSEPSRRTASAIRMASADISRCPVLTAFPIDLAAAAISRPWLAIQMLCQPSISTAMPRMVALNSSWPLPSASSAMRSVRPATTREPARPAATPTASQRLRPDMPRVAAATMLMSSAASRLSRNTMRADPNMGLLRDDHAARGLFVEFAKEGVLAGCERADVDRGLAVARDHFLAVELVALEFLGRAVLVLHDELDLLAGGHLELGWGELVVLDCQAGFEVGGHGGEGK